MKKPRFHLLSGSRQRRRNRLSPLALLINAGVLLLIGGATGYGVWRLHGAREGLRGPEAARLPTVPHRGSTLSGMAFPTPRQDLLGPAWDQAVQPTASGRPESALFGSTRTSRSGLALFHEGVDIAVVERDARGRPVDPVTAVAEGRVAYVNRTAGDSTYGLYVMLAHPDPVGIVYTLYAHLADVASNIHPGKPVLRGQALGTLGHTPAHLIPQERAHLHFEIGLLINSRYDDWIRAGRGRNAHGAFNGRNMGGLDPLIVLRDSRRQPSFSLLAHLQSLAPAFALVIRNPGRTPDFFVRHPALWRDAAPPGPALVLAFTESGLPLSGRNATREEADRLGRMSAVVLTVDPAVLGRNGRRLVVKRETGWELGRNGEVWLRLLLF